LFFPLDHQLPADLRSLLLNFVPSPAKFVLSIQPEPPATLRQTIWIWTGNKSVEESEDVVVRIRDTAREAQHDVKAVLRLVEAGRVRVTDKKRRPTAASMKHVAEVLLGGDFYGPDDQGEYEHAPDSDLAIKSFAWPMLVQAGGLTNKQGDNLELTPAGRKALSRPASETIRSIWKNWHTSQLLDEFSRIEEIKGQGKARLSALANRRKAVIEALAACPIDAWFNMEDFFRFMRATGRDFEVAHEIYNLYIAEHQYGNLGYEGKERWEMLQGRYILALFFEYAATLGLIDVAYVPPQGVRDDYRDRWGTDDLGCLSRYDGLICIRINPLGAWCLGLTQQYEPPATAGADLLQVLPNYDIVVRHPPLPASDRLLLDRFADAESPAVWRLKPAKLLAVLEAGGSVEELEEFLAARTRAELPQTVRVFLDDIRRQAKKLRDLGLVRLVECADPETAQLLANEPQMRDKCSLAGDRRLVFRLEDEAAIRRTLRRLGHVLPAPN
jgi:hypothetical protein